MALQKPSGMLRTGMSEKRAEAPPETRRSPSEALFSVRVLDAKGRELSRTQESTLHIALVSARLRLRERIHVAAGAHKAEVRAAEGLIYDVFAEQHAGALGE